LKAGEVLSAANLADVTQAQELLASVTGRHQAARDRRSPSEVDEPEDDTQSADLLDRALEADLFQAVPDPPDVFTAGAEALFERK
jgi:hypothetical protein